MVKGIKILLKRRKIKSGSMVANDIKISEDGKDVSGVQKKL